MTLFSRSTLLAAVAAIVGLAPAAVQAQRTWTVDSKESLAWWQMSPHFASLWGTTCPEDPSWEAGEGGSSQWPSTHVRRTRGYSERPDTVNVPLYPRRSVEALCRGAVSGRLVLPDTSNWGGIRGEVTVAMDSLEMGSGMRDRFAYATVFGTSRYPTARYRVDSIVGHIWKGDTLVGTAMGIISIRGKDEPLTAAMRAWPDSGGMRVLAKLRVPAHSLEDEFGMSRIALSLGVGANLWEDLFMGVDLVLRPEQAGN